MNTTGELDIIHKQSKICYSVQVVTSYKKGAILIKMVINAKSISKQECKSNRWRIPRIIKQVELLQKSSRLNVSDDQLMQIRK